MLQRIREWTSQQGPRRLALEVGALVVVLLLAFAWGRYSAPKPDVKVRETQVIQYRDRVVTQVQRVEVAKEAKTQTRVVYRTVVVQPNGAKEIHEEIRSGSATQLDLSRLTATDQVATHQQDTHTQLAVDVHTKDPSWRVGVLAGVEPLHLLTPQLVGPVALGGTLEWRVWGPLWIGAWGISSGSGGIEAHLDL